MRYQIKQRSKWLPVFLLGLLASLASCDRQSAPEKIVLTGETMGTYYRVTVADGEDVALDRHSLQNAVNASLEKVIDSFSTYEQASEITALNRLAAGGCLAVSEGFEFLLRESLLINEQSNGRFNPAVAPLVDLWGFGAEHHQSVPDKQAIAKALGLVDLSRVQLKQSSGGSEVCKRDAVELDFSAIAKGFAVDKIVEALERIKIENYLVDIGGELRGKGVNNLQLPWQVAIEKPADNIAIFEGVALVLDLSDSAIATSGNYRNFFYQNDIRYGHTLDPQTGMPLRTKILSATVVHHSAATADAWATALMASTFDGARRLAMENKIEAILLVSGSLWETQQLLGQSYYQTGQLIEGNDAYTIWHSTDIGSIVKRPAGSKE